MTDAMALAEEEIVDLSLPSDRVKPEGEELLLYVSRLENCVFSRISSTYRRHNIALAGRGFVPCIRVRGEKYIAMHDIINNPFICAKYCVDTCRCVYIVSVFSKGFGGKDPDCTLDAEEAGETDETENCEVVNPTSEELTDETVSVQFSVLRVILQALSSHTPELKSVIGALSMYRHTDRVSVAHVLHVLHKYPILCLAVQQSTQLASLAAPYINCMYTPFIPSTWDVLLESLLACIRGAKSATQVFTAFASLCTLYGKIPLAVRTTKMRAIARRCQSKLYFTFRRRVTKFAIEPLRVRVRRSRPRLQSIYGMVDGPNASAVPVLNQAVTDLLAHPCLRIGKGALPACEYHLVTSRTLFEWPNSFLPTVVFYDVQSYHLVDWVRVAFLAKYFLFVYLVETDITPNRGVAILSFLKSFYFPNDNLVTVFGN